MNEMQIKAIVRYHLTPIRMLVMKNTKNKCLDSYREIGAVLIGIQCGASAMEIDGGSSNNLKYKYYNLTI